MHDEMLTYGLKRGTKDDLRHIDSVPKGLVCDCVCPHCQHNLIARNGGTKKTHHFAHASGADCGGARMTALHILAQKILERDKVVMLPVYETEYIKHDAQQKEFANVVLEQVWKDDSSTRKPDCVCSQKGSQNPLWVEIYCRHKVDKIREEDIKRRQVYCVEIDFSDLLSTEYNENDVIERLTNDTTHKRWICCPVWDKENEIEHQKILAEEEREARETEELRSASEKEYQRLKSIVDNWQQKRDTESAAKIIEEIKRKPFSNPDEEYEWCIYELLVPDNNWVDFAKHIPKTDSGREVFYALIHYYVRANFSRLPSEDYYWVNTKITDILSQDNNTKASYIQLEYILVLWILSKLEKYRNYKDEDSEYGKVFAHNEKVRRAVLRLICAGKRNWKSFLANQTAQETIVKNFSGKQGGDDVIAIIRICFPIKEETHINYLQQEESTHYEPYGYDKEFAGININDAWKQLNEAFKEQKTKYK